MGDEGHFYMQFYVHVIHTFILHILYFSVSQPYTDGIWKLGP